MVAVGGDQTGATITGLSTSRRYGVKVRAWTSAGPGPESAIVYEQGTHASHVLNPLASIGLVVLNNPIIVDIRLSRI